jgi:hypothetical protein
MLCKTYAWQDDARLPRGLPLCSELTSPSLASLVGAAKAYRGFTYTFNGTKWVKGNKADKYNSQTQGLEPWSSDQYDPLSLLSKEEKATRLLTVEQIRKGPISSAFQSKRHGKMQKRRAIRFHHH